MGHYTYVKFMCTLSKRGAVLLDAENGTIACVTDAALPPRCDEFKSKPRSGFFRIRQNCEGHVFKLTKIFEGGESEGSVGTWEWEVDFELKNYSGEVESFCEDVLPYLISECCTVSVSDEGWRDDEIEVFPRGPEFVTCYCNGDIPCKAQPCGCDATFCESL